MRTPRHYYSSYVEPMDSTVAQSQVFCLEVAPPSSSRQGLDLRATAHFHTLIALQSYKVQVRRGKCSAKPKRSAVNSSLDPHNFPFQDNSLDDMDGMELRRVVLFAKEATYLKKNQSTSRPSEHPPVMGGKMSKPLGGIKSCKYITSSWHSNRFPDADNIGSTV